MRLGPAKENALPEPMGLVHVVRSFGEFQWLWGITLGVDSDSIIFNHRSFQKPAVFPKCLMVS